MSPVCCLRSSIKLHPGLYQRFYHELCCPHLSILGRDTIADAESTKTPAKKGKGTVKDGEEVGSMSASDVKFLVGCLQNTTGRRRPRLSILGRDTMATEALGYENIRSLTIRLATIKKKYNLPIGSTSKSPAPTASVDNVDFPSFGTPAKATAAKSPAAPPKTPKTKAPTTQKSLIKKVGSCWSRNISFRVRLVVGKEESCFRLSILGRDTSQSLGLLTHQYRPPMIFWMALIQQNNRKSLLDCLVLKVWINPPSSLIRRTKRLLNCESKPLQGSVRCQVQFNSESDSLLKIEVLLHLII